MIELAVVVNEIFEQRLPEAENGRAFVLGVALDRVNHLSGIRQGYVPQNFNRPGFDVDFDFGRAEPDLPERRGIAERNVFITRNFKESAAPDLPFRIPEVALHDVAKIEFLLAEEDVSVLDPDVGNRRVQHGGRRFDELPARVLRRQLNRQTHNRRRAARVCAFVEWRVMRVEGRNANLFGRHR